MAAINKRKVLESAQRNLQKGALDKALKDYQSILNADPRDTGVRLKCGDLLQRMGRNDDAIAAYLKVADQFQRDGFDAKAVALYKQVTKIDDKRHDVYVPLADLYQRLGLLSEAMGALQTAADAFHRDGRKREALDLLRRMASLDPANVTSRLKVAELLQQEGLAEEAVAEFREAAAECERQGDWEALAGALERVVEMRPECVEELEALGGIWLDHAQPRRAHQFAQKLVEADPDRPESQELLARVLAALGQEELAIDAFRACAEAWRQRGEEGKAREIVQRHLPPQDFSSLSNSAPGLTDGAGNGDAKEVLFGAAGELGGEAGAGEGVFGSEPIEVEDGGNIDLGGEAAPFDPSTFAPADAGTPEAAPAPSGDTSDPGLTPRPEGDVEQLLAEAAVYLRYRKHERAIASLQAALQQAPENLAALEQLGEAHAIAGAPDRAVEAWARAAQGAAATGEAARSVVLRGRIAELDAAAAAALELAAPECVAADEPVAAEQPVVADEAVPEEMPVEETADAGVADGLDEIEIDIDDDVLASEIGEGDDSPPSADATSDGVGDDGAAFELELGDEDEADEPTDAPAATDALASAPEIARDGSTEDAEGAAPTQDEDAEAALATGAEVWELPLDESDDGGDGGEADASEQPASVAGPAADASAAEQTGGPAAASGGLTSGSGPQIQEDFEEAGFYFEQGLFAEAEAIYRRILEHAPSHPGALLRLGEIAFQRGGAPESVADPAREESTASASGAATPLAEPEAVASPVGEEPLDIEPPDALDLTTPNLEDTSPHDWSDAIAPASDAEESTANVHAVGDAGSGHDAVAPPPVARVPRVAAAAIDEPELTTPDLGHGDNAGGASFDLAAELSEAMSDAPSAAGTATDGDGFASLFRDFKRGVSQTLGEGDVETHFDLGIAYREMGLFEDAIGEFRYALGFPSRRLDALQLMGLCALDLGRAQDAVGHLEQALASPDVPADREAPLRYELGRAYHSLPDRGRALETFRRVYELEPDFQDVADRVAELERADDGAAEASRDPAEAFESFDDLVADAALAVPVERFESFDDLVAEANDERPAEAVTDAIDAETEAAFVEASVEDDDTASGLEGSMDPDPRAGEPVSEAELESEPEPESGEDGESEPQPAEPAASAPRRRRKVSFV